MFALTCAHRDYPLGTKLRVSNPANGKEVECIVNDREPLVTGRDIDLCYAAAKKIGLIGPGVAKVDVEPLGRYTRYVNKQLRIPPARRQPGGGSPTEGALSEQCSEGLTFPEHQHIKR